MAEELAGAPTTEGNVEALSELLAGLIGTGSSLRLYKSSMSPNQNSVLADFVAAECDFSGYAGLGLAYAAVGLDAGGNAVSYANRNQYQNSSGAIGNSVGGAWVTANGRVVRYFPFVNPIPMSIPLATLGAIVVANASNILGSIIIDN